MIPSRQSSLLSYVIYIVGLHVCISTFGLDLLFWLVCVLLHKKCFVVTKWGIFWERLLMLPEVFVFDGCLMKGGSRFHYYNTILSKSLKLVILWAPLHWSISLSDLLYQVNIRNIPREVPYNKLTIYPNRWVRKRGPH